jgi:hypothetical protein
MDADINSTRGLQIELTRNHVSLYYYLPDQHGNTTNILLTYLPSQHHHLSAVYTCTCTHALALTRMHETSHLPILPVQSDAARGIHVYSFSQACHLAFGSAVLASSLTVY